MKKFSKNRVFLVFNVDYFAKSHFEPYINELLDKGYDVNLLMNCDSDTKFASEKVTVRHIPFRRSSLSFLNLIIVIFYLYKNLFTYDRDLKVVQFFTAKPLISSFFLFPLKALNYKFVNYITGIGYIGSAKSLILNFVKRFFYPFIFRFISDVIIVENSDDQKYISKYNPNVYKLNGAGCDVPKTLEIPFKDRDIDFIFVARLLKDKGVIEFCDFIKTINQKHVFKVVVVGDLDIENPNSLTSTAFNELKSSTPAEFVGYISEVERYLKRSKYYILPSYREGFPKSIMEAMANGCVVLTSDVAGCRDAVINGETGFLFEPHSSQSIKETFINASTGNPSVVSKNSHAYSLDKFQKSTISKKHEKIIYSIFSD